jgi:ABC-type branched-subunit amino acid transport system substrate-binding protein
MKILIAAAALAAVVACTGCGGHSRGTQKTLLIAVNAPFSQQSSLGESIARGVQLAAAQVLNGGGIPLNGTTYTFRVKRYDNGLSARTAAANVRHAIDDGAVAIVDEGTGIDASWQEAEKAGVPIAIVHQGAASLVDPQKRPNVFRIVPTDHGIAFRFAEYLSHKHLKLALVHDDSEYGRGGEEALDKAFSYDPEGIAARIGVSAAATDYAAPVLRARKAGATGLMVWGRPGTIAGVVRAARRTGWDVPIYAPPDAADPLVRQELSDHPEWLDGLTFGDGRLTSEVGPGPYYNYESTYESAFGPDLVGVKTKAGREVIALPEYSMYASDFVNVLVAAITRAGGPDDGKKVIAALNQVSIRGANGDERGFNEANHDGVVDDDVYFAVFHDMTYRPVKDDPLSSTLPTLRQVQ